MLQSARRLRREAWELAACCLLLAATPLLPAQTQVLIEFRGSMEQVVAMDGEHPLVQTNRGRQRVYDGRVSLVSVGFFTDGAIRILEKDAAVGQDYDSSYGAQFFRFVASVQAERDFEDCFILFAITPEQGEPTYVMRELPDLMGSRTERIQVTTPINQALGGGTFAYKIYSQGEEVEVIDPEATLSVRQGAGAGGHGARDRPDSGGARGGLAAGGRDAEIRVVQAHLPDFPESLVGQLEGGYVEALYQVGPDGRASALVDLLADHPALVPEALRAVAQTRYQPAMRQGRPQAATARQRFFFHEFATFPEALIAVPDPPLQDREPAPIYYPLPTARVAKERVVEIGIEVDRLGRARSVRILAATDDELADALVDAAKEWIFLPAIREGQVVKSKVSLPVRFTP